MAMFNRPEVGNALNTLMAVELLECFEVGAYKRLVDARDRLEGVAAFDEKRQPVFKSR